MPVQARSRNGGPAVAPRNRAALIASARRLFAEQGYRTPLTSIAKAAGVGQGVLYRHFPSRLALALEVFAENFEELERVIDTTPGPECFHTAWYLVVGYTVSSSAFVEMAIEARSDVPESLGSRRLERLLAEPLARAQQAGLIDPTWTPQDIVLLQRMVHGVVISEAETEAVPRAVRRALELVDASLVPPHWSQQRRAEPR